MKISVFAPIKNEAQFIGYGIMSLLPHVDELVYGDANSSDGTVQIIEDIQKKYDREGKIKLVKGFDFADFKEDYTRKYNELMDLCSGEYIFYCHPDMILTKPGILMDRSKMDAKAYFVNMRSFAGESMELEIVKGRTDRWKLIMRNALGLHYHGFYGEPTEDMYFRHITGSHYQVHKDMKKYPFEVVDSGIELWHFCECKPKDRRTEKMERVFKDGLGIKDEGALNHPRVTLKSGMSKYGEFRFEPRADPLPSVFELYKW